MPVILGPPARLFYFKKFRSEIGKSGRGYSKQISGDDKECYACCVLLDKGKGLVTAYPLMTVDSFYLGVGERSILEEDTASTTLSTPSIQENDEDPTLTDQDSTTTE